MELRIAHRQSGRTTVQCDQRGENFFALHTFFSAVYFDDEKALLIMPASEQDAGSVFCDHPGAYRAAHATRQISFTKVLPEWLPAFHIDDWDFDWDNDRDALIWHRPPVWALGWPQRGPEKFEQRRAVALYGFDVRLASAKRNRIPLSSVVRAVPEWACKAIGTVRWCDLVRQHAHRV